MVSVYNLKKDVNGLKEFVCVLIFFFVKLWVGNVFIVFVGLVMFFLFVFFVVGNGLFM